MPDILKPDTYIYPLTGNMGWHKAYFPIMLIYMQCDADKEKQ